MHQHNSTGQRQLLQTPSTGKTQKVNRLDNITVASLLGDPRCPAPDVTSGTSVHVNHAVWHSMAVQLFDKEVSGAPELCLSPCPCKCNESNVGVRVRVSKSLHDHSKAWQQVFAASNVCNPTPYQPNAATSWHLKDSRHILWLAPSWFGAAANGTWCQLDKLGGLVKLATYTPPDHLCAMCAAHSVHAAAPATLHCSASLS